MAQYVHARGADLHTPPHGVCIFLHLEALVLDLDVLGTHACALAELPVRTLTLQCAAW